MSHIIVLTIGPVQSYISQARRTQDLWQGSRILSYLAGEGIRYALEQADKGLAEVIYPSINRSSPDNIPNRLVVRWLGDSSSAAECARSMEHAVRRAWQTMSENTLHYFISNLKSDDGRKTVSDIWQRQQDTWLECYWVVTPYAEAAHADSIKHANAAMGARKLLRSFPPIDEPGRKCSITGEHEALHTKRNYVEFWQNQRAEQHNLALLGANERLSAISTIKRFAHAEDQKNGSWHPINPGLRIDHRFPSTSSIAPAPFKYAVLKVLHESPRESQKLLKALKDFIAALLDCFDEDLTVPVRGEHLPVRNLFFSKHGNFNPEYFPKIHSVAGIRFDADSVRNDEDLWATQFMCIDGDYLFEDTLTPVTIAEYMPVIKAEGSTLTAFENKRLKVLQPKVTKALQKLKELVKQAAEFEIPKPQPYLAILSMDGDNMGKTLGGLSKDQHRKFSETLSKFARERVHQIVEQEHLGRVVYAGGDDVLALLPVPDALKAAEALRAGFEAQVASIGVTNHRGERVTASTGLAYVHHTHNLQDAVRAANEAQHIAKERYKRGAIGVEFLRRSGERRSMGHKWYQDSDNTVSHLEALIEAFGGTLSRSFPYDIAQIAYSMGQQVPEEAVQVELRRILRRRLSIEDKAARNTEAEILSRHIMALKAGYSWENVQRWLELARFVAQKEGDR